MTGRRVFNPAFPVWLALAGLALPFVVALAEVALAPNLEPVDEDVTVIMKPELLQDVPAEEELRDRPAGPAILPPMRLKPPGARKGSPERRERACKRRKPSCDPAPQDRRE